MVFFYLDRMKSILTIMLLSLAFCYCFSACERMGLEFELTEFVPGSGYTQGEHVMQFYILICDVFWHKKDGEPVFQVVSATSYPVTVLRFQIEFFCELKNIFGVRRLLFLRGLWFVAGEGL